MENKINIAELLKDCPTGMELNCIMFDNAYFEKVNENSEYPIRIKVGKTSFISLTKYGCWNKYSNAKCVIFPKGKTTWEGFQRPFKDGDIVVSTLGNIAIIKKLIKERLFYAHGLIINNSFYYKNETITISVERLATEEEKQKLFNIIKESGYKWNTETKTLEKLNTYKFALQSIIRLKGTDIHYRVEGRRMTKINGFEKRVYHLYDIINNNKKIVYEKDEDNYELVPNKLDITTLKPFSKVLVRDKNTDTWEAHFFSRYHKNSDKPYVCIGFEGINEYKQCITYEQNKELLGTTNDCDSFYKSWDK